MVFRASGEGGSRLYRRLLSGNSVEPLPGTEGGFAPFFSPDGEWLAFFNSNQLLKVPINGGTPVKVCGVPPVSRGGVWTREGTMIFARAFNDGLWIVSDNGGEPRRFTHLDTGEHAHMYPETLPGGRFLFTTVMGEDFQDIASSQIVDLIPNRAIDTSSWRGLPSHAT